MRCNLLFVYVFLMASSIAWAGEDLAPGASITEIRSFCLNNPGRDYRGMEFNEIRAALSQLKRAGDTDLKCANFEGTDLKYLGLENVDLRGANFNNSHISYIRFGGRNRQSRSGNVTTLKGASFKYADIRNCIFYGVVAEGADFSHARMENNDFSRADFPRVQFVRAEFLSEHSRRTNWFQYTNLRDSDFAYSRYNVGSVFFREASLEGANFDKTRWATLEGMIFDNLSAELREDMAIRGGSVIYLGGTWYNKVRGADGWYELGIASTKSDMTIPL